MKSLMLIPRRYLLIHKFLLTFPIQRWDIKHLIPFWIPCMERMFHIKDINLQIGLNNEHWNHLAQWYGHPCFYLWSHFVLVHYFNTIQFCLVLDRMDIIYAYPTPWNKQIHKCYKSTIKYVKQIHNFENTNGSQL